MTHKISIAPLNGPLPIPHFLGWPGYTSENTYDLIVPETLSLAEGDIIEGLGSGRIVQKIIDRRPAKGDWSKQKKHNNPHFVRIIAI